MVKVNTRYSRALLGVPFIPYLQNLLPKVIPLTANSSASLHKQNLAMSELVELLGTEEALPYRMALPLSPAISLSSFIGTLSVFSVLPPILHLCGAFRSPAGGVSLFNSISCNLSCFSPHGGLVLPPPSPGISPAALQTHP